ncbi:MAG: flagellar basal-body rod protein FlgG [Burkholderiales bacterium]|nr:flagellar basal-body rod protein FlgG [Burkholderiales bacterium]
MNDALYIAATAMQAQQLNVDTIANNLANVNTSGYKAGRVNFTDLMYREQGRGPVDETGNVQSMARGTGVGITSMAKLFTDGELKKTDGPLDVAIRGTGFFEVTLPDGGSAYMRGGSLQVNRDGFLAAADGSVLKPNIHIGQDVKEVVVESDGRVLVRTAGQTNAIEVGRIELVSFSDPSGLVALGQSQYKATEKSGDPIYGTPGQQGLGTIAQGFVESSNVKMLDEMVNLMVAQRAYEMSVKVIQAADEMLGMSNNLRR